MEWAGIRAIRTVAALLVGEVGAVTSSREDAILRLGNGSQGARQMERASRAGEKEREREREGEWENGREEI